MYKLIIKVNNNVIEPPIIEPVKWTTELKGAPSELEFEVLSSGISIPRGTEVQFWDNNERLFFGYVFNSNNGKDKIFKITAYDQLRYLKNKDIMKFENMTASEIIKKIANDTYLRCGDIEDTNYKIASRVENGTTYFDMILNALDITLVNTGNLYILDDDFGKIRLRNISKTKINLILDEESAENYSYSASIDNDTYNQIKLIQDGGDNKSRKIYIAKDSSNIQKWGLLQMLDSVSDKENGQVKADALLKLKNRETKEFSLKKAFGDNRIRAGARCYVKVNTEDETIDSIMLVEKAKHTYYKDEHTMDVEFKSGEYG